MRDSSGVQGCTWGNTGRSYPQETVTAWNITRYSATYREGYSALSCPVSEEMQEEWGTIVSQPAQKRPTHHQRYPQK